MKNIYYAHTIGTYGTPTENRDLETIKELFPHANIVNPADIDSKDMKVYLDEVLTCDMVIFRAMPDGSISAGVGQEIQTMLSKNGSVMELPTAITRRTVSVEETREFLKESGAR